MKKIVISASLCLLLSSCFTYRNIDLDKGEFNQEDIFKIIKTDEQIEKGKLYSLNDSLIVLQRKAGTKHIVLRTDIQEIRKRKFSLGKSIALPFGITAVVTAVALYTFSNWSISLGY